MVKIYSLNQFEDFLLIERGPGNNIENRKFFVGILYVATCLKYIEVSNSIIIHDTDESKHGESILRHSLYYFLFNSV